MDYDCLHDTQHFVHKYQDMDRHISDFDKLCPTDILSSQHILVDIPVDFRYNLASKSKLLAHLFLDTDYWAHMVMVDKDSYTLLLPLKNDIYLMKSDWGFELWFNKETLCLLLVFGIKNGYVLKWYNSYDHWVERCSIGMDLQYIQDDKYKMVND